MQNLNLQYPMMYNNDPMMYGNAFQPNNLMPPNNFAPQNNFFPQNNFDPSGNFMQPNNVAPSGNFIPPNNFDPSGNFMPPNNFDPSGNFFSPENFSAPNNAPFNPQQPFQSPFSSDFSQPAQLPTPGNPVFNANLAPVTSQNTPSPNNNSNQVFIAKNIIEGIQGNLPPQTQDHLPTIMNTLDNLLMQIMQQAPQNIDDINQLQKTIDIIKDIRKDLPVNMQDSVSMVMQFLDNSSKPQPLENPNLMNVPQSLLPTVSACTCTCPQHGKKVDNSPQENPLFKDIRVCQKNAFILPENKEYYLLEKTNSQNGSHYSQQQIYLLPKGSYMIVRIPSSEEFDYQKSTMNATLYQSPGSMEPVQLPVSIPTNQ